MADEDKVLDTHYEVALDDEPDPTRGPVYVDVVTKDDNIRPIIPAQWRGKDNIKATVKRYGAVSGRVVGYHALRAPLFYVPLALFWSVVGVFRLLWRQIRWAFHPELNALLQEAATKGELKEGRTIEQQLATRRTARAVMLLAELVALAVAGGLLFALAPRYILVLVGVGAVPLLAHYGRPATMPIVTPAVVRGRYRLINSDTVLQAYYAAGLGNPAKEDQKVGFLSRMERDGEGGRVKVVLPAGKGFGDVVKAREALASGLDVAVSQVFLTRDPESNRSHYLWVADRDPLAVPAGRTPLLRCRQTDIWKPAPLGLDERGQLVTLSMLWTSILVGAQPRQGKSFTARALALYAALDPYVKLTVFDGKGSPDWRKFRLVADRCAFGLAMSRDGDPVEIFVEALRELKADVQWRYQRLSELPVDVCPEGKLTREIARNPKYKMPVRVVVIDECQEYFDTGDPKLDAEIASLLVFLVKVAPAAGVIVLDATQKPSGVGTQKIAQKFTSFRDNHQVRFALRTGSWQVSDLVLGSGAYSEGYDSSLLLPTYKGVGILRGASDDTPTVRTFLADAEDAEKILIAARRIREQAGTLSGMAAGEDMTRESRDVLADVIKVWSYIGRQGVQWPQLAELLAAHMPEQYAGESPESISALIRGEGVPSVDVKTDGVALKGCRRRDIEAAIERRQIAG
ncbi:cell division protein FtsK [Micromonospora aurantiaca]|uniref:Cell division protein FtsK n=1 Tax=Micromonospora aurantiaca (nom. illeg.) TaxID=47850 RepID=A0A6N3JV40_9ACTN|nr:cell division protein FtsK [Micromonospora aurantiaca]AXH89377.1 cell division protein FtsK [Micromonospora aurantiaca]